MTTAQQAAVDHFAAKLRFETDASDVRAALEAGEALSFVDVRSEVAWRQGRAVGAIHLPRQDVAARALDVLPREVPVVVYCWGPGCNGSTKAALELSRLVFEVREMIGGFEYWAREGLPTVDESGDITRPVDELTGPRATAGAGATSCDC